MPSRRQRLLPDDPVARRLSLQSILYALGDGVFTTGNAVYFTQIVGLSAAQVGLGLSVTGVVALALSVPMGRLSDRYGARRMWAGAPGWSWRSTSATRWCTASARSSRCSPASPWSTPSAAPAAVPT